jgi:hypothetical protein
VVDGVGEGHSSLEGAVSQTPPSALWLTVENNAPIVVSFATTPILIPTASKPMTFFEVKAVGE